MEQTNLEILQLQLTVDDPNVVKFLSGYEEPARTEAVLKGGAYAY
jgi:hypothetical protein